MYEFFLTAVLSDDELVHARALLQGYCAMPESHQFHRVLFSRGPDRPNGFKKTKDVEKTPNFNGFRELQQYLTKQSFILQARYQLNVNEFGAAATQQEPLDKRQGTLRWTDLPEPIPSEAKHVQRKVLDIPRQDDLLSILEQNAHTLQAECIEESYNWWRGNTEYSLKRSLRYPGDPLPGDAPGHTRPSLTPRASLPSLSDLVPLGPSWILQVRVLVPEARPELSNQALSLLGSITEDLGTCFAFTRYDRRVFDTRIQTPVGNAMPKPLPSVVRVGRQS